MKLFDCDRWWSCTFVEETSLSLLFFWKGHTFLFGYLPIVNFSVKFKFSTRRTPSSLPTRLWLLLLTLAPRYFGCFWARFLHRIRIKLHLLLWSSKPASGSIRKLARSNFAVSLLRLFLRWTAVSVLKVAPPASMLRVRILTSKFLSLLASAHLLLARLAWFGDCSGSGVSGSMPPTGVAMG